MAVIEVELGDDGRPVKDLPTPLKKLIDVEFDRGFAKGAARKVEELKDHLADPAEKLELARLRKEAEDRAIREAEQSKEWEKARELREAQVLKERETLEEGIRVRDQRIQSSLKSEIRAAAVEAGARAESLEELEAILLSKVSVDQAFNTVVLGDDGKPLQVDGKPDTVAALVTRYLDAKPHHRKGSGGTGGGAPGGSTTKGGAALTGDKDRDAAVQSLESKGAQPAVIGALLRTAGRTK